MINSVQEHSKSTYGATRHMQFAYGSIFVKCRFKGDASETSFRSRCKMAFSPAMLAASWSARGTSTPGTGMPGGSQAWALGTLFLAQLPAVTLSSCRQQKVTNARALRMTSRLSSFCPGASIAAISPTTRWAARCSSPPPPPQRVDPIFSKMVVVILGRLSRICS